MTKKTKKSQRDAFIDEVISTYDKLFNKALETDNEELFSRMLVDFSIDDLIQTIRDESVSMVGKDSQVSLGIVTESPTSTFIQWGSPIYSGHGSLKTMVQTGYHDYNVYESLLFQYIHAMSILQEENIAFENFDPSYNLFVKDIYVDDRDKKHWRYVVDGVEYFVPNYGYIGLVDSFYGGKDSNPADAKIDMSATKKDAFDNFKKIIDVNFYNGEWRKKGAHNVPPEFIVLLNKLNDLVGTGETNIKEYLKLFTGLLNNRIGESVTVTEMNNIDITRFPTSIKPGSLVARRDNNEYKWAVVLKKVTSGLITKYLVQTDRTREPETLSSSQLYLTNDNIEPKPEKGIKFDSYSMIGKIGN